jgi:hypothetical protein
MRRAWMSSWSPGSTQTTKRGREESLVKEGLDFDALAPDAVSLEPVEFRTPVAAFREEAYDGDAFELAPATFAITLRQVTKDPNTPPDRDNFDRGDLPDDLEVHVE